MSLFLGRVNVQSKEGPSGNPLYDRFWQELGKPLQNQPPSDRASAAQETAAKELLKNTLQRCKKLMPKTQRYLLGEIHDFGYLGNLMRLRRELGEGRWCDACYTLCKVIKYYCANDIRTMYAIIGILEDYI